ncbi:hypothetical protein EHS39_33550 [Ensifer sp. MPMI2T]|nr:hypothetical protein EHS39_33550 [Ensifer sp. MPMI2T]
MTGRATEMWGTLLSAPLRTVASRPTGADMGVAFCRCVLAQAHGQFGEMNEGLTVLEKAFAFTARSRSKYQVPELLRTKGEILSHMESPGGDAAERWFQKSLTMACAEGTKSTELRAAASLARLYIDQGRDDEARSLLAPVYAWFTEGFETGDLVDAKALLDCLR